jgi:hypothetical protein
MIWGHPHRKIIDNHAEIDFTALLVDQSDYVLETGVTLGGVAIVRQDPAEGLG